MDLKFAIDSFCLYFLESNHAALQHFFLCLKEVFSFRVSCSVHIFIIVLNNAVTS